MSSVTEAETYNRYFVMDKLKFQTLVNIYAMFKALQIRRHIDTNDFAIRKGFYVISSFLPVRHIRNATAF